MNKGTKQLQDAFKDLTLNQRMSVMNLLMFLSSCDSPNGESNQKELQFLNYYTSVFGVKGNECLQYLQKTGKGQMIEDLGNLTYFQKDMLVVISHDLLACDGAINETEGFYTVTYFEQFGIDENAYMDVVEKSISIVNTFSQPQKQSVQNNNTSYGKSTNSSCYIATMVYQDIDHPQVEYLRQVRDEKILNYYLGKIFVKYYYKYSPILVERLENYQNINRGMRKGLDVLIVLLKRYLYR